MYKYQKFRVSYSFVKEPLSSCRFETGTNLLVKFLTFGRTVLLWKILTKKGPKVGGDCFWVLCRTTTECPSFIRLGTLLFSGFSIFYSNLFSFIEVYLRGLNPFSFEEVGRGTDRYSQGATPSPLLPVKTDSGCTRHVTQDYLSGWRWWDRRVDQESGHLSRS